MKQRRADDWKEGRALTCVGASVYLPRVSQSGLGMKCDSPLPAKMKPGAARPVVLSVLTNGLSPRRSGLASIKDARADRPPLNRGALLRR